MKNTSVSADTRVAAAGVHPAVFTRNFCAYVVKV